MKHWIVRDDAAVIGRGNYICSTDAYGADIVEGDVVFVVSASPLSALTGWGTVNEVSHEERFVVGDDEEANSEPYPTYTRTHVSFTNRGALAPPLALQDVLSSKESEVLPEQYEDEYGHTYGGLLAPVPDTLAEKIARAIATNMHADLGIRTSIAGAARQAAEYDVFVSYAHEDLVAADRVVGELRARGYTVWFDRDSLLPGMIWAEAIVRAINKSKAFVAILSRRSLDKRGFVQKELREAMRVLEQTSPLRIS